MTMIEKGKEEEQEETMAVLMMMMMMMRMLGTGMEERYFHLIHFDNSPSSRGITDISFLPSTMTIFLLLPTSIGKGFSSSHGEAFTHSSEVDVASPFTYPFLPLLRFHSMDPFFLRLKKWNLKKELFFEDGDGRMLFI